MVASVDFNMNAVGSPSCVVWTQLYAMKGGVKNSFSVSALDFWTESADGTLAQVPQTFTIDGTIVSVGGHSIKWVFASAPSPGSTPPPLSWATKATDVTVRAGETLFSKCTANGGSGYMTYMRDADTSVIARYVANMNPSGSRQLLKTFYGKLTVTTLGEVTFAWMT